MTDTHPPPPPRCMKDKSLYAKISVKPPDAIARAEIKETHMATCGKFAPMTWDDQNIFKYGIGANEKEVYDHYIWLIDNIFPSAGIDYLKAQFNRGYVPRPIVEISNDRTA